MQWELQTCHNFLISENKFTLPFSRRFVSSSYSLLSPIDATENPRCFSCPTWSRITETKGETTTIKHISDFIAALASRGKSWKIKLFPKPVGRIAKMSFPRARFTRHSCCSFLSAWIFGNSYRQSSKMEINWDSSKSLAQATLAIFLIDKIWGNRWSVDSTVKIDQSEGIAAPAIPEEGR